MIHAQLEHMVSLDFYTEKAAIDAELSMCVEDTCTLRKMEGCVKKIDNRYEVALPWKRGRPSLPNNRGTAVTCLNCLRQKFLKEPELFNNNANKIDNNANKIDEYEYFQLGYSTKPSMSTQHLITRAQRVHEFQKHAKIC